MDSPSSFGNSSTFASSSVGECSLGSTVAARCSNTPRSSNSNMMINNTNVGSSNSSNNMNGCNPSHQSASSVGGCAANIPLSMAQRSMQFVQSKNEAFRRDSMKSIITKQRKTKDIQGHASTAASESLKLRLSNENVHIPSRPTTESSKDQNILNHDYRASFSLFQLNEDYKKRLSSKPSFSSSVHDFLKTVERCQAFSANSLPSLDKTILEDYDSMSACSLTPAATNNFSSFQDKPSNPTLNSSLVNYYSSNYKLKTGVPDLHTHHSNNSSSGIITHEEDDNDAFPLSTKLKRMMTHQKEHHESKLRKQDAKEEKDKKLYLSIEQSLPAMVNVFTLDNQHLLDSSIVLSIQNVNDRQSFVIDPRFNIPSLKKGEKFVLSVHNRHLKPVRFCIMFRDPSGTHVSIYPKKVKLLQSLESDLEYLPSKEQVSQVFDSSLLPTIADMKTSSCKVSLILMATTHIKINNAISEICSRIQGVEKNPNSVKAAIMDRDKQQHHPLLEDSSSFKRVSLKSIELIIEDN
ncbi:hypothetical protein C9374_005279 [Naegleria lovaniensis]|uniref:Uncharacterized protein n=1 Tax=Naegleria lovaniensis TaxID=51637 RepID=A0AA88KID3_NAELO|nr:uncharacterized protein C9374_005279 [Naegleria lovaniensis]KAG2382699.1 hypothetical protein C9374_005279 [Naegleria lovaniensis]